MDSTVCRYVSGICTRLSEPTLDASAPDLECLRLKLGPHDTDYLSLGQSGLLVYHSERGMITPSKLDYITYAGIAHYAPSISTKSFKRLASARASLASFLSPSSESTFDCSSSKLASRDIVVTDNMMLCPFQRVSLVLNAVRGIPDQ